MPSLNVQVYGHPHSELLERDTMDGMGVKVDVALRCGLDEPIATVRK
jgi:hypothetical protein